MSQHEFTNTPRLFISYARDDDRAFAEKLYRSLIHRGLYVWWDEKWMSNRGLTFLQEIHDAIARSDRLILIVGPNAVDSEYVKDEWTKALSLCIPINPVLRLGEHSLLPDELRSFDTPDFRDDARYDEKFEYLFRQLHEEISPLGNLYNVPPLPTWYIPRISIFNHLSSALRNDAIEPNIHTQPNQHRTVTVSGIPGIGKTMLASAVAHDCNIRRTFKDGVFWIELGQNPNIELQQGELIHELDRNAVSAGSPHSKSYLNSLLANKKALIILNDVWKISDLEHFRFSGSDLRFLIITRNKLLATQIGGITLELSSLDMRESLQLLSIRLGIKNIDEHYPFKADHIQIAETLQGHTLAIAIAAAQLVRRGTSFAPELARRLQLQLGNKSPFYDLQFGDSEAREFNLELSLSLSYADLSEELKIGFRALGVFSSQGTFDIDAAHRIFVMDNSLFDEELDTSRTHDLLDLLVDANLVYRYENNRYVLHRLLKFYALALLKRHQEFEERIPRFALYYSIRAAEYFRTHPDNWHHITNDLPQIHEAGNFWVQQLGGTNYIPDLIERLSWLNSNYNSIELEEMYPVELLKTCETFGVVTSTYVIHWNIGIDGFLWLFGGLVCAKILNNQENVANLAYRLGIWHQYRGDLKTAGNYYIEAIEIFSQLDNKDRLAMVLLKLGSIGNSESAKRIINLVEPLLEKVSREEHRATLWAGLGMLYCEAKDYDQALKFDELALEYAKSANNKNKELFASVLNNIGMVYQRMSRFDQALEYLNQALSLAAEDGNNYNQTLCLMNLGFIHQAKGNDTAALEYFLSALQVSIEADAAQLESKLNHEIALLLWKHGNGSDAVNAMLRAREIKRAFNIETSNEDELIDSWLDISGDKG